MLIDGKKIYEEEIARLSEARKSFDKLGLGVILVGEGKTSEAFIKRKKEAAAKLEIGFYLYQLSENLSREKLRDAINQIVGQGVLQGVILQLPLPKKFNQDYFINTIPPEKDVDCLSVGNIGKFYNDRGIIDPPAVEVVKIIKKKYALDFSGKTAVVYGYGKLIGRPISFYLRRERANVIIPSSLEDPKRFLLDADIVVSGVGKGNLISDCKLGATVIDFGYDFIDGKICGDVDWRKIEDKAALVTLTPGGTGPILVAAIFENLLTLAGKEQKT